MIFSPGVPISIALLCGFGIVPILVALSHGPVRIEDAKKRYLTAVAVSFFTCRQLEIIGGGKCGHIFIYINL